MFSHNFLTYSGKVLIQILGEILYFPIWWYTVGFFRFLKNSFRFFSDQEKSLGFLIWAKNLFVPMYGQYDWAGRLISFVIRLVQIVFRGLALFIWLLLVLLAIVVWLMFPIFLLLALAFQVIK